MTRIPVAKIPRQSDGEEALAVQIRMEMADYPPVREYQYALPERRWAFDFAWPEWRVAIEVEGGTWSQGRHTRGSSFEAELRKYNAAMLAGWLVLRVSTEMVVEGGRSMDEAIGLVKEALTLRVTRICQRCHYQWRPLATPRESARHQPLANGLYRCQGHSDICRPVGSTYPCTSDHK